MSLRAFHIFFIVVAVIAADLCGAWMIQTYRVTHQPGTLVSAIATLVGGLALAGYGIWFVNKMNRAHLE